MLLLKTQEPQPTLAVVLTRLAGLEGELERGGAPASPHTQAPLVPRGNGAPQEKSWGISRPQTRGTVEGSDSSVAKPSSWVG